MPARRPFRLVLALATLGTALLLPAPAHAQFGSAAGFGEIMTPYFARRDLQIFADALELDDAQMAIVEQLFWDYEAENEESKQKMMDAIEGMRDQLGGADRTEMLRIVFEPFMQKSRDWERSREVFLQNMQVILNEQQLATWPDFEKRIRREKEAPKGELSGEKVDLLAILRRIDLAPTERRSVEPLADAYAEVFDQALRARERLLGESRVQMMQSMRAEDNEASLELFGRQLELRKVVRDVNAEYLPLIADALPDAKRGEFVTTVRLESFPRVYRPLPAERLVDAAAELEDITAETRAAIGEISAAFHAELETFNDRLVVAIREWEPRDAMDRAEHAANRGAGRRPPTQNDAQGIFAERDQMARKYVMLVKDLLTPEQFAKLPGAERYLRGENVPDELGGSIDVNQSRVRKDKIRHAEKPGVGATPAGGRGGKDGGR